MLQVTFKALSRKDILLLLQAIFREVTVQAQMQTDRRAVFLTVAKLLESRLSGKLIVEF